MAQRWTRLYKYISTEYAIDILEKGRLYLSDGTNFNDPFELAVTAKKTDTVRHIDGLHILSLTNSNSKKLMWSHYADSHKGLCLTVEVPANLVYPICYTSERIYEDSDLDQIIQNRVKVYEKKNLIKSYIPLAREKKIAYIKDRKWSYEREYRIVFNEEDELHLIYEDQKWYMPVKITNVYLGVRFDSECQEDKEILEICERNGIKVTRMVLSKTNYALEIKRIEK